MRITRFLAGTQTPFALLTFAALLATSPACPHQTPETTSPRSTVGSNPEFLALTDEVLKDMSEITGMKLKTPLKRSIRSRQEIRAYVLAQMNDEKDAKERYASGRSAEIFGLIPKNFNLETFLVDLLTEQIAGLYDPKAHEFYIADWIPADEQRMVMSHELTHALQDQYFHIESWTRAARPNDDAELARESVLEGSAMAGMLEYELRDKGLKLRDLPEFDPSIFVGDLAQTPMMKKAPPFIKDSLLFPYMNGLIFSMSILRTGGWGDFASVFARPPADTQQIMHPDLYRATKVPAPLKVDLPDGAPGAGWDKLEENSLGEFGWKEVIKQFLDADRAMKTASGWDGDDYITFEQKSTKHLMLFTRERFNTEDSASSFFNTYSEVLAKKYTQQERVSKGDQSVSFDSPDGGVFFRCVAKECLTLEGGDATLFSQWTKKLGWSPVKLTAVHFGVRRPGAAFAMQTLPASSSLTAAKDRPSI
jgi:hypothetical protein